MEIDTPILPEQIRQRLSAIRMLCNKHHIKRLWVFGSVLRDDFRSDSDIDFLYELDRTNIKEEIFLSNFFGFYDALKMLFNREIDLVKYKAISNPYFLAEIDETKVLLYDQESKKVSV